MDSIVERRRSNWWFLLPVVFTIAGGLVAYFAIRCDDAPKARNCLYLGIAITAVDVVIVAAIMAAVAMLGAA